MDSKSVDLAIADMPGANQLTLHVLAAEHERHTMRKLWVPEQARDDGMVIVTDTAGGIIASNNPNYMRASATSVPHAARWNCQA